MRLLRPTVALIRENRRAYLLMNAIMYGVCLVGVGLALAFPELNAAQGTAMREDGTLDLVMKVVTNFWLFSLTIFVVNTFTVSVLMILLPSLVVPFAGIVLAGAKSFQLGMALAPVDENTRIAMIPHSPTILIEFQAYVLVMFGAYLIGRAWLRPRTVGAENRRHGYVRGLRQFGRVSLPALALLVIGALYEAFEIIYVVPPLIALLTG